MPAPAIRPATNADLPAMAGIYAHHVLHGTASFETEPPTADELGARMAKVREDGLPWIVAELDGTVVGYAYATIYRGRRAYRYTAEDSVYVRHDCTGRGMGRALLQALIEACEQAGCRQMVAVIGDSANAPSIALHEAAGFRDAGILLGVGFKFGRWLDTVRMQRQLGDGDTTQPDGRR